MLHAAEAEHVAAQRAHGRREAAEADHAAAGRLRRTLPHLPDPAVPALPIGCIVIVVVIRKLHSRRPAVRSNGRGLLGAIASIIVVVFLCRQRVAGLAEQPAKDVDRGRLLQTFVVVTCHPPQHRTVRPRHTIHVNVV